MQGNKGEKTKHLNLCTILRCVNKTNYRKKSIFGVLLLSQLAPINVKRFEYK